MKNFLFVLKSGKKFIVRGENYWFEDCWCRIRNDDSTIFAIPRDDILYTSTIGTEVKEY